MRQNDSVLRCSCLAPGYGCGRHFVDLDPGVPVAQTDFALAVTLLADQRKHVVPLLVSAFAVFVRIFQSVTPSRENGRSPGKACSTCFVCARCVRRVIKLPKYQLGRLPVHDRLITSGAIADHLGFPFIGLRLQHLGLPLLTVMVCASPSV